jgi:hypothetical protein
MDNVFLEALAAIDPLTFLWFIAFLWFTARFGKITVPSGVQEGDFIQKVYIYSEQDPKVIKHGTVLIDPGNNGPNLITEDVMRYVHGQPTGSEQVIRIYDGDEKKVGGEVELSFSGPSLKSRRYTETFRHVPRIVDGIDMVLNHDFYVKRYPDKIPSMLMIRWGRGNEKSKGIILFSTYSLNSLRLI